MSIEETALKIAVRRSEKLDDAIALLLVLVTPRREFSAHASIDAGRGFHLVRCLHIH